MVEMVQEKIEEPAAESGSYDECMARVMRIADSKLRFRAMSVCDEAL